MAVPLQFAITYEYNFWGHRLPCRAAVNSCIFAKYRNELIGRRKYFNRFKISKTDFLKRAKFEGKSITKA